MRVQYKLKFREGPQTTDRYEDYDGLDQMLSKWDLIAQRLVPETDSEAAREADKREIQVAIPGDHLTSPLCINQGTKKKEASRMIANYRQVNRFFGKLNYVTAWEYL